MADIAFAANLRTKQNRPANEAPLQSIVNSLPPLLPKQNDALNTSIALPEYMTKNARQSVSSEPAALPLSNLESPPEPFEQADAEPEPDDNTSIPSEPPSPITGNDTVALDMDEFMNS
jgi:hypothetical protein